MRLPDRRITRRLQIVRAILRHGEFARGAGYQVPGTLRAGQRLFVNLLLQRHESVQERFRPWRAAGYMHFDRNVSVDAFEVTRLHGYMVT